jgi:Leucine-rich repeat (LRR) protein
VEDGAFSKLPVLEELNLSENRLVKLPMLPAKLTVFNANYNLLKTRGVKATAFKVHNLSKHSHALCSRWNHPLNNLNLFHKAFYIFNPS